MIIELHRRTPNNVGDYYCNPSRYFPIDCVTRELITETDAKNNTVIIGGGGLIHKKFNNNIKNIIDQKPNKTIIWAIGHNFSPKAQKKSQVDYYPDHIMNCNLVGIRDYIDGYKKYYLPCVSCMHPAFDKTYEIKNEVVFYTHAFKSKFQPSKNDIVMSNSEKDFDKVISFLGSANTVVTDSYHGAYWAQLLGKDVRVLSWSVKFDHMKYPPSFLEHITKWQDVKINLPPAGYLDESRELNIQFYQKFLNLF